MSQESISKNYSWETVEVSLAPSNVPSQGYGPEIPSQKSAYLLGFVFSLQLHCCEVSPELENLSSPTGWSIEMQNLEFL